MLQKLLGFDNYLFLFSLFTIRQLKNNRHEREFLYFLKNIRSGGIVLDIGANIGITAVPLAQEHKSREIYAFEPVPQNLAALKRVIKYHRLTNIRVFEFALGKCPGELTMVMPVIDNVRMQGLSHVTETPQTESGLVYTVPVRVLDELDELKGKKVAAIKIDVENFEFEVLSGAVRLLSENRPLIYCELWDNEKRGQTIALLEGLGYRTMFAQADTLLPYSGQPGVLNYFFVKE